MEEPPTTWESFFSGPTRVELAGERYAADLLFVGDNWIQLRGRDFEPLWICRDEVVAIRYRRGRHRGWLNFVDRDHRLAGLSMESHPWFEGMFRTFRWPLEERGRR